MCRTHYLTHVNGATIHLDTSHDTVLAPSTFFFVSEAEKPLNKGQDQV